MRSFHQFDFRWSQTTENTDTIVNGWMIFVVDIFHLSLPNMQSIIKSITEIGVKVCLLNSNNLKCIKIEFSVFSVAISKKLQLWVCQVKYPHIFIILQINRRSIFSCRKPTFTFITRPMQWLNSTLIPAQWNGQVYFDLWHFTFV